MNLLLYIDTSNGKDYFKNPLVSESLPEFLQTNPKFAGKELLYFYQPQVPTVIVGHYQDVYHEVNLKALRDNGVHLVRRNSGGGAVFVDPGDLTYVYIDTAERVKTPKFSHYITPILKALQELGIDAKETGRNDLTVDGQKFSGMSFAQIKNRVSYGGTLMLNVDLQTANQVLTPPKGKLADKGIKSVRSRVTNLLPYIHQSPFTVDDLRELIVKHVREENPDFETYQFTKQEWEAILDLGIKKYGTTEWIYGSSLSSHYVDHYFHGIGNIGIAFDINQHRLANVKIYGDLLYLNEDQAGKLEQALDDTIVESQAIEAVFKAQHFDEEITSGAAQILATELVAAGQEGK